MIRPYEEPEDAHEGYFASISDLMVGILFIFLLMLAVFAISYADEDKVKEIARLTKLVEDLTAERDRLREVLRARDIEIDGLKKQVGALTDERDRLRAGIAELVRELEGVRLGLRGEQGRLEGVRSELLHSLQQAMKARDIEVEIDTGQGILRLRSEGLFLSNEDRFTPTGRERAEALIEEVARRLPCFAAGSTGVIVCDKQQPIFETVLIEGHTDTNSTKRGGGNWTLSTDRARAFLELMIGSSSLLGDLRNSEGQLLLGLAGYGETRPIRDIAPTDERNRRIEIRFLLSGQREENLAGEMRRLEDLLSSLRSLTEPKQ